jgi:hypothetical protein
MPRVLPVTKAVLPVRSMGIGQRYRVNGEQ